MPASWEMACSDLWLSDQIYTRGQESEDGETEKVELGERPGARGAVSEGASSWKTLVDEPVC